MRVIRSRIAAAALTLLAWQVAAVCIAPAALGSADATHAVAEAATCTCDHAEGGVCPMHGAGTPHAASNADQPRWCAGCGDEANLMIQTLLAASGGLPEGRYRMVGPAEPSEPTTLAAEVAPDGIRSPHSPPPRR